MVTDEELERLYKEYKDAYAALMGAVLKGPRRKLREAMEDCDWQYVQEPLGIMKRWVSGEYRDPEPTAVIIPFRRRA